MGAWELPTDRMPTEHEEQMDFVRWFRRRYDGVKIYAIPNGGERSKSEAMRLKAEGVLRGVHDLHVPAWRLWVEMKRERGGSISAEQKEWAQYVRGLGDTAIFCYGSADAQRQILELVKANDWR